MHQEPIATLHFTNENVGEVLEFLKRTRVELRTLRKVHVWPDRLRVFDVNGDCFEVTGVGYVDENIRPILDAVHTSYKPESIHNDFAGEYKEFMTGKRHPWAEDRVM
ncbi:MAG: hypothetical protein H6822_17960 [Planctomycetaceae bacterium]|nr:hypothetical protein [Planctomycetales bacterium]MCB9924072.1 hypothetical protein [Planctomycetaceae bacterium]